MVGQWDGNFILKNLFFSVEYLDEEKAIQQDERQRNGVDQLNDPEMPAEGEEQGKETWKFPPPTIAQFFVPQLQI
jgi:hypothetical protein